MTDAAARSVYRAIWNTDYDTDLTAKGRSAAHQLAEDLAGTLTRDGLLATPQPEISGPERDRLCKEAKTLGLAEAYLERRGETTWIRAARVVRAVHNHLPGRAPIGLREAKVLGEAIAIAFEHQTPSQAAECSCDATGAPEFPHRDWCELNHPHHPCDARSCRFRPIPAVDREALLDVLTTADEDLHNEHGGDGALMNRNYLEYLADRLIAADAIAGTP